MRYPLRTLVAFSGEVSDPSTLPDPVTKDSPQLNPRTKSRNIRDGIDSLEFSIQLAAKRFQTGFDQPLLCGMYVDKRSDDIKP